MTRPDLLPGGTHDRPRTRTASILILLGVLAVAFAAFWPSLQGGLVSDDFQFTRRPWGLNFLGHLASGWEHQLGRATAYRPFTVFTYGLNQWLWSSPVGFHAGNILIHAVASGFATLLARRLGLGATAAGVCGVLFALHPVHGEAVSWISGRTATLAGALSLGAMWLATFPGGYHAAAATTLAALAILSYEGAFLLPAMLVAVVWYLQPAHAPAPPWRRVARTLAPLAAVWLFYVFMRWFVISGLERDTWALSSAVTRDGFALPVSERAWRNTLQLLTRVLGAGYGLLAWQSRTFLLTSILVVVAAILAWRHSRSSRRLIALAIVVSALAFAPYVTYTGYADRFAYLPSIGVCVILAAGVQAVLDRDRFLERACVSVAAVALGALWVRQLVLSERDWNEAGVIAEAITTQAAALGSPLPQGSSLHVIGVPLNLRGAYVFITYFDLAVSQALARSDVKISMDPDPAGACPTAPATSSLCLRWDAQQRTLSVAR